MKMWIHNELTWNSHERSKFSHYVEHWILFAKLWLLLLLFLLGQVTLSIWRWCDEQEHAWWLHEIFCCVCVCMWVCAHVLPFNLAIRIFPHHWMGDALIKEFKLKVKVKCQNVLDIKFIKFWYLHRYIYLCLFLFFSHHFLVRWVCQCPRDKATWTNVNKKYMNSFRWLGHQNPCDDRIFPYAPIYYHDAHINV